MRFARRRRVLAALLLCLAAAFAPHAEAQAPVLLPPDPALREDLEWLVERGVLALPLATWPLPSPPLEAALARLPATLHPADADALARVRRALARERVPARLALRLNSARHPALDARDVPRGRAAASLSMQRSAFDDTLTLRLAVGAVDRPLARDVEGASLEGSYALLRLGDEAVLAFAEVDRWWGPTRQLGPLWSDAAPPVPGLVVRRSTERPFELPVLAALGPWGYEVSLGELRHFHPAHTRLLGLRVWARPFAHVEVAVSRALQWGGAGRAGDWPALREALLGHSNVDDPSVDPSDEIAGFDVRVAGTGWAAYAQLQGEDEAGRAPSAWFGTLGAKLSGVHGRHRWSVTLEGTDTVLERLLGLGHSERPPRAAYTHHVYTDGWYHQGLPLGAAIGGGGQLWNAQLAVVPLETRWRWGASLYRGRVGAAGAQAPNAAFGTPGRIAGGALFAQGETAGALRWSAALSVQSYAPRPSAGVQAAIELPLPR